jgi:Helix-turn-helix domain
MRRVAAFLPGYATVSAAAEVLHLAPRSVRDLIYAGRLPSMRISRLHYIRASDLETERRRRLGLRLPAGRPRMPKPVVARRPRAPRPRVDPAVRRSRAAERAASVTQWAQRHDPVEPRVPFGVAMAVEPGVCAICRRPIRARARYVESARDQAALCMACGRRALLDWADRRRLEAAAARRIAQDLGSAESDSSARVA